MDVDAYLGRIGAVGGGSLGAHVGPERGQQR